MILKSDILEIGSTLKPHGINGEISADIDEGIDPSELRCIVLSIDGIFVPFFIESVRSRSASTWLLTIDGVSSDSEAKQLCGKPIYALKADLNLADDDGDDGAFYLSDMIGFQAVDPEGNTIGYVSGFDDSTDNTLLILNTRPDDSGENILVPAADEFFNDIDTNNKTITLSLPEGLINLQ